MSILTAVNENSVQLRSAYPNDLIHTHFGAFTTDAAGCFWVTEAQAAFLVQNYNLAFRYTDPARNVPKAVSSSIKRKAKLTSRVAAKPAVDIIDADDEDDDEVIDPRVIAKVKKMLEAAPVVEENDIEEPSYFDQVSEEIAVPDMSSVTGQLAKSKVPKIKKKKRK